MSLDILTKKKFSEIVEGMVANTDMSYVEAICQYCEDNSLDISEVPKLISPTIKEKMAVEAQNLNIMKKPARLVF